MNKRIAEVRKEAGINQQDFADRIGITKNYVSLIETGGRIPSDRTISDICREFHVNEQWLRTGEGEMHPPKSRGEEIGEIVRAAAQNDPEEAEKFFRGIFEDMTDGEILLMYEVFKRHFPGK